TTGTQTDQPTLTWTAPGAVTGTPAAFYTLWLQDQNKLQVETIANLPLTATSYTLTATQALTPGDSYLWYVGTQSTNGQATNWSNGGSNFAVAAMGAPSASQQATSINTDQPTFGWTAAPAGGTPAGSYEL